MVGLRRLVLVGAVASLVAFTYVEAGKGGGQGKPNPKPPHADAGVLNLGNGDSSFSIVTAQPDSDGFLQVWAGDDNWNFGLEPDWALSDVHHSSVTIGDLLALSENIHDVQRNVREIGRAHV